VYAARRRRALHTHCGHAALDASRCSWVKSSYERFPPFLLHSRLARVISPAPEEAAKCAPEPRPHAAELRCVPQRTGEERAHTAGRPTQLQRGSVGRRREFEILAMA